MTFKKVRSLLRGQMNKPKITETTFGSQKRLIFTRVLMWIRKTWVINLYIVRPQRRKLLNNVLMELLVHFSIRTSYVPMLRPVSPELVMYLDVELRTSIGTSILLMTQSHFADLASRLFPALKSARVGVQYQNGTKESKMFQANFQEIIIMPSIYVHVYGRQVGISRGSVGIGRDRSI